MKANTLALLALLPLMASCASQKVIDDYEAELGALRDERTSLKSENQSLRQQLDDAQISLMEANSALDAAQAAPAVTQDLPQFGGGIETGYRGGHLVISIPSSITFASGKATLSEAGKRALQDVARVLVNEHPNGTYWVEGHTDSDPIQKSGFKSNRALSVARAESVLTYFVEQCGVPDSSCVLVGHGQYEPLASNSDAAGKARNRRVEVVVHE